MTILIVDDCEGQRRQLREILVERGYAVAEAANGVEALERAAECAPDLILMDIQMPRMNGVAALKELRDHRHMRVPVIAMTAFNLPNDQDDFLAAGFNGYLPKPIRIERMLSEVRRHLGDWAKCKPA